MNLKERNFEVTKELESFRILKGKLLVDIKNSFDRISKKEDEAGKLTFKMNTFEKKILDLHFQEEVMLARSSSMGCELSHLTKELDLTNTNALASFSEQINLLRDKYKLTASQVEFLTIDLIAKEFESFILASELLQMGLQKVDLEREQEISTAFLEDIKNEFILLNIEADLEERLLFDTEAELFRLKEIVANTDFDRKSLSQKLKQCSVRIWQVEQEKKTLEQDIHSLKLVACSNDNLESELADLVETKERLRERVQLLEIEAAINVKEAGIKETSLNASICELETQMDQKDSELNNLWSVEKENEALRDELRKLRVDYNKYFDDFQEKELKFSASYSRMHDMNQENQSLQGKVCTLEDCIAILQSDRDMRTRELEDLQHSQSIMSEKLSAMAQDLEIQASIISSLKEDNYSFRSELMSVKQNSEALLSSVSSNGKYCTGLVLAVDSTQKSLFQVLDGMNITLLEKMYLDICEHREWASNLVMDFECTESFIEELTLENLSFKAELLRKDEILNGLSFDLSMLQETASNTKDKKDEVEEMMTAVESLEDDLALRSAELEEAVVHNQMLEVQLQEKLELISDLELDLYKTRELIKLVKNENVELKTQLEDVSLVKGSVQEELKEKNEVLERLEEERLQMDNALGQMNTFLDGLKNDLNRVTCERDLLDSSVSVLKEKLEMTQAVAEENEALVDEARQIADSRKTYAEAKEEEVKLLERSVEELESTVDVLENKVDIVRGETERQRLLREELETEIQIIRNQMISVTTPGSTLGHGTITILSREAELQRHLEEKDSELRETREQIKILLKNIAEKDGEISQCREHISELNLHAEAQAHEYKQKFKALEAMAEQVRPDSMSSNTTNSSSTKPEKNSAKPRGSGSPFKCIGLGLSQQINSEKDEELTAGRLRIQELEALASSRQKEIFTLNARLAAAESMTHDVIRDLLGVKLDMTHYASLLDHQQPHRIAKRVQVQTEESLEKKQEEIIQLKHQLNELIEEKQGWLEDIKRRHAEMVAAQIAAEKLQQRDQFLTTENDMLKKESVGRKKKVMELEDEVKKLSEQQNLQQRIHHHAKIKEQNNLLKIQNEELSSKLQQMETFLSCLKEELACYRESHGKTPFFGGDKRLTNRIKETEEECQLAPKLSSLCTSILEAAGIKWCSPDATFSMAKEAVERLKQRTVSLERELQDLKLKNSRICSEKVRLSEVKQQSLPPSSRTNENCTTPERVLQIPFFTALDR